MKFHFPPALRYRQYRLLWFGLMISIAGAQMQLWALFWNVRTLTDQPIYLGLIGAARIVPIIIFSLIGGAVADVFNRRKILFITQSVMACVALVLAWLSFGDKLQLWHIYLLTAIQAMAGAFDLPARQSLVPNLVPGRDLPSAFSLNSIAFQTGSIIGPALGGLVIAYWGQAYTYLINAITYLAVLAALALMGNVAQKVEPGRRPEVSLQAIGEGISFILKSPIILSSMLLDFFATFFSSANTLLPFFVRDVLHVGAVEYGWLASAQAIGAVGAALVISQMHEIRRQGYLFLSSVVVFGAATVAFGLSRSFWLTLLSLIVVGAADSVSTIIRNTIRQLQTPDYIRGRMTSVNQIFFTGGPQLGEVEAGLAAQFFGVPFAIISGGIGCIIAVGAIVRIWPQLLHYNGDEPVLAGEQLSSQQAPTT
jgi:MFS family permease